MAKQRHVFSAEFKREAADLVLKQNYSFIEASCSLGIGESALRRWVSQLLQERRRHPAKQGVDPRAAKDSGIGSSNRPSRTRGIDIKKSYHALDVGRSRALALIHQLSGHEPVDRLCEVFEITRSAYYANRLRRGSLGVKRIRLRTRVNELFTESRSAAGSRSIVSMIQEDGEQIERSKVRGLMREQSWISKQQGSHAYKKATIGRPDIPNALRREFDVPESNKVWCGDITYIWAQGKWHYLAVVMDLYARRIVGWDFQESRMLTW